MKMWFLLQKMESYITCHKQGYLFDLFVVEYGKKEVVSKIGNDKRKE